ncbi:hypothetical protein [Microcoleus sp. POL1_C1]|uniref:hypothetical protein n=1 Tax=Microcoleus sp. POL1_C1 TaxID=2818870 RepID=UPI002FD13C6A
MDKFYNITATLNNHVYSFGGMKCVHSGATSDFKSPPPPAGGSPDNTKGYEILDNLQKGKEPGASLNSTPWTDDNGGALVFPQIQAKTSFTVDVTESQVSEWEKVLNPQAIENGEHEVTLAVIKAAVDIPDLLALASLIAYGLSRGYSVTEKKTGTAMQFEFKPKCQVSYTIRGVYTSSRPNLNEKYDFCFDGTLMDNDGYKLGTLHIMCEPK